jgi:hypothetical protein
MPSNLSAAQQDDLAQRRAAHDPVYWMALTEDEAHELAAGRVPDQVQAMARWLDEPVDVMLVRKDAERRCRTQTGKRPKALTAGEAPT